MGWEAVGAIAGLVALAGMGLLFIWRQRSEAKQLGRLEERNDEREREQAGREAVKEAQGVATGHLDALLSRMLSEGQNRAPRE